MKEVVLITGAGGMVAQHLAKQLQQDYAIRFLSRNAKKDNEYRWDLKNNTIDPDALQGINHIIHLAGASVAKKRWTKKRKEEILKSRVDSASLILNELTKQNITIDSFISASAIGFYGSTTTEKNYTEKSDSGGDFLSRVCTKWESAAKSFEASKTAKQVKILRIGVVLSEKGGILKNLQPLTKYYLGTVLGNGRQYIPWIHIDDLCRMFQFVLENKTISGVFNAVAPHHINNKELTKGIAKVMNKSVILPNVPKFLIRMVLGEMSVLFTEGSMVSSEKVLDSGFKFKYGELNEALNDLIV